MKSGYPIAAGVAATLLLVAACGGCGNSSGTSGGSVGAARAKYLLATEPAAAQSVMDVHSQLEEQKAPADVVIVGRIGGLGQPTWDPEQAAFMVADLSLAQEAEAAQEHHDETPKHDADNCPFCRVQKKKELAGLALVQVVDAEGSVPPVDARELLGLCDGQTIVIRGKGEVDSLGTLVVRTDGIYVRP
jgi:hypothetical protein